MSTITLALLAAGHHEVHRRYVRSLDNFGWVLHSSESRHPREREFGEEILGEIGWVKGYGTPPPSSYLEIPAARPPGRRRIGLFGASSIEGCEATPGDDFPSLLQKRLPDYQVVNFGVSMYGLHQTVRLWERVGRTYDLDQIVLFPEQCHVERDATFNYSAHSFGPIHGRYILTPSGPEYRSIPGRDATARSMAYFSWLPPWDVVRHDQRLPSPLQCLIFDRSDSRRNPFYYEGAVLQEMEQIGEELLVRMARAGPRLILACTDDWGLALARRVAVRTPVDYYASTVRSAIRSGLPIYAAPFGHLSANGNELMGRELHQVLQGEKKLRLPLLRTTLLDATSSGPSLPSTTDALACFRIAGRPMMSFRRRNLHPPHQEDPDSRSAASMARSSLILVNPEDPGRPVFVAVEKVPLSPGPITLRFTQGGREKTTVAGRIETWSPRTGVMRLEASSGAGWRLEAIPGTGDGGDSTKLVLHTAQLPENISLDLAGIPASFRRVRSQSGVILILEPLLRPRSVAGQRLPVESLPARGTIDFVALDEQGIARAYPCLGYTIEDFTTTPLVKRSSSGTAIPPGPSP